MLNTKTGGGLAGRAAAAQGWDGHLLAGGEQSHCTSLVLYIVNNNIYYYYLLFSVSGW